MSNTNIQCQVLGKKRERGKTVKASTIINQYIQVKRLLVKMKEIEKRRREDANEKLYFIETTLKLYEVSMWEEIEDAG